MAQRLLLLGFVGSGLALNAFGISHFNTSEMSSIFETGTGNAERDSSAEADTGGRPGFDVKAMVKHFLKAGNRLLVPMEVQMNHRLHHILRRIMNDDPEIEKLEAEIKELKHKRENKLFELDEADVADDAATKEALQEEITDLEVQIEDLRNKKDNLEFLEAEKAAEAEAKKAQAEKAAEAEAKKAQRKKEERAELRSRFKDTGEKLKAETEPDKDLDEFDKLEKMVQIQAEKEALKRTEERLEARGNYLKGKMKVLNTFGEADRVNKLRNRKNDVNDQLKVVKAKEEEVAKKAKEQQAALNKKELASKLKKTNLKITTPTDSKIKVTPDSKGKTPDSNVKTPTDSKIKVTPTGLKNPVKPKTNLKITTPVTKPDSKGKTPDSNVKTPDSKVKTPKTNLKITMPKTNLKITTPASPVTQDKNPAGCKKPDEAPEKLTKEGNKFEYRFDDIDKATTPKKSDLRGELLHWLDTEGKGKDTVKNNVNKWCSLAFNKSNDDSDTRKLKKSGEELVEYWQCRICLTKSCKKGFQAIFEDCRFPNSKVKV